MQGDAIGRRLGDDAAGDVVRVAERDFQGAHQPVGEIGGGGIAFAGRLLHLGGIGHEIADHAGHRRDRQRQSGQSVHDAFLVLLHVLGISERQSLHDDENAVERADDAAGLAAHQFGRVRVALLRHDGRAGGELVGQLDQADERRGPHHDFLGKARQMHRGNRRRRQSLHGEVAVGDGVERIGRRPVEAERLGRHVAVERERRAGERGRTERHFVEPLARVGEAATVTRGHLDISQEMMPEGHRLRRLQMGEARHHRAGVLKRLLGQRQLIGGERGVDGVDRIAHPQPEIGRHLVVARARGVQAAGRRADEIGQPALDVHMNVFERALEGESAALDL